MCTVVSNSRYVKILEIPSGTVYSMGWSNGSVSWIGAMELNIGVEFWSGILRAKSFEEQKTKHSWLMPVNADKAS